MIVYFDRKRALKRHPRGLEFLFPKAKSWPLFADVLPADTSSSIEVVASADLSEMLPLAWAASLFGVETSSRSLLEADVFDFAVSDVGEDQSSRFDRPLIYAS
jgi:hypothetical protein